MKANKLLYLFSLVTLCFAPGAFAFPDAGWTGLANDGLWTSPNNWNPPVVPGATTGDTNTSVQLAAANGWSTITVPAGATITLDNPNFTTVFGPDWGAHLDIYGSLSVQWYLAPAQWDSSNPSVINVYSSGSYSGEGIGLGYNWWWNGGPYCTLNLFSNATVNINWMFWGGHMNLYGGTYSILSGVTDGNADAVSDATRYCNITGGKFILPASFTGTVNNWISRNILFAYGKTGQTNDLIIDEADLSYPGRTVVSATPLGGALQSVAAGVSRTNMMVGTFQQARALGNFPNVTNAVLTFLEPGTVTGTPAFQSSNPSVLTVTSNGLVTASSAGTASLTLIFGAMSNSVTITVTPYVPASLTHRYSFTEASGATTTADSVGGAAWDGTLNGGASLGGGELTLDGSSGYVQLPAGIVTNMDAVSIETWVSLTNSIAPTNAAWAPLYAFGDQNSGTLEGRNYIVCQPRTGSDGAHITISDGDPGYTREQAATLGTTLDGMINLHLVAVYHPLAGYAAFYTNGVLAGINNNVTITLPSAVLGDPFNLIGRSLYDTDPYLGATLDEFRIHNGELRASEVQAHYLLGPNQLMGTAASVSLTASLSGADIVIRWPTNSASVNLVSSPALESGAVWSPVNGTLAISGGDYQVIVPAADSARFFRLQQ